MDQSTHGVLYDTMTEKCALLCILLELLRAQTGFRPWKYAAKYRFLCLTYFLIDSFKNESFQHRLPFQKHLKATACMHCFCSIECLRLGHCMKRCHLGLCLLTTPTFQGKSIFVLILRYKATVNSSLCRDKRGKKEMNQHSHISFREEEEGSKIRFTVEKTMQDLCNSPRLKIIISSFYMKARRKHEGVTTQAIKDHGKIKSILYKITQQPKKQTGRKS